MVRPASALSSSSLGQLCSLRALASSALSVPWPAPPSPYLISSYFVWSAPSSPSPGPATPSLISNQRRISELWPAPPSLSPFQLRCLRTLTSSGLRPRASSAVSKPVPGPPPSPSAFQPRCLRILVSSTVSEPRPASPSPRIGRDQPSPGPESAPPSPSPGPLRHFRAISSSAVSYPWLDPPSPSPQKLRARGQLSFSSPGPAPSFPNIPVREYLYTSSRTGPGLPPTLKVGGGGRGSCPSAPCSYATGTVPSRSLAHDWNSTYRRVLPQRIG